MVIILSPRESYGMPIGRYILVSAKSFIFNQPNNEILIIVTNYHDIFCDTSKDIQNLKAIQQSYLSFQHSKVQVVEQVLRFLVIFILFIYLLQSV